MLGSYYCSRSRDHGKYREFVLKIMDVFQAIFPGLRHTGSFHMVVCLVSLTSAEYIDLN